MSFVLRTQTHPAAQAETVRTAMKELSPDLPIIGMKTMDELFSQSIGTQRLTVVMLSSFAALALILAAVGLYGVVSYTVTMRTREIGVRMALGAEPSQVLRRVLKQGVWLTVAGLALGLVGALCISRLMASILYEVSPFDGISFATVGLLLGAIGLFACLIPARRATRIDPLVALRAD
jgi:putative ABC transport system permease protein